MGLRFLLASTMIHISALVFFISLFPAKIAPGVRRNERPIHLKNITLTTIDILKSSTKKKRLQNTVWKETPEEEPEATHTQRGKPSLMQKTHHTENSPPKARVLYPIQGSNLPPQYPILARQMGYEGEVVLKIEILPDGSSGEIITVRSSGFNTLDHSAHNAVSEWKWNTGGKTHRVIRKFQFVLNES